jgi:isoamylase
MVRRFHEAGLEVLLDVVYNHTAEGDQRGPTFSFRGIDNASYYRLASDPRYYDDVTGCGNSLALERPRVLQLVLDSLRYWAGEMHVDGFRFDLAPALARYGDAFRQDSPFLQAIGQDPLLSRLKLIAEPWDLGPNGYQLGHFPPGWSEWNDTFRDGLRRFWRGGDGEVPPLAARLTGSSEIFRHAGRTVRSSLNFVTAHDGFTLHDLVSYDHKHNLTNGEDGRDGSDENLSWNSGAEGPSDDPEILALRARRTRSFLATLFLSQGVPMLLAGDERGRTQLGNNNAYCQDGPATWVDWAQPADATLPDFVRALLTLRRATPALRRERFFDGRAPDGAALKDITWLTHAGYEMSEADWLDAGLRFIGLLFGAEKPPAGEPLFLMYLNAHAQPVAVTLPPSERHWELLIDTAGDPRSNAGAQLALDGAPFELDAFSLVLLRSRSNA